jgi:glyoxylase-like metal-dependent hydrolase (beta-lactamase superfamily II)
MKKNVKIFLVTAFVLSTFASTCVALSQASSSQPSQQPPPLSVQQVKGNIYEVKGGSGANAGFFIGDKEVLVVDAKMTPESAKEMLAQINRLTSNPIVYVALTHSDGDHVNGLTGFPNSIRIIAHQETRKYMEEAFQEPAQIAFLPQITFSQELDLYSGKEKIRFLYFGPAHTSGDAVIYFPEEKVAFVGDLLFLGRDPLIHRNKNGNSFGVVKNLKAILELDVDTFVHGHGDLAGRSDVEDLIKSIEEKQQKIKSLISEGKSLEEIKSIFKVEERPAQPGKPRWMSLVEVIYLELTEAK